MSQRLVLASASPRRRELLAGLGVTFEVIPAGVDEEIDECDPGCAAEALAVRKAEAIAQDHADAVVIGSDTVVALDGEMLGKPASADEARSMLHRLRGRAHTVHTGVAVSRAGSTISDVQPTAVQMRPYADAEIEAWIATGEPFDKAGGYAIQDATFGPVASIAGCECNVIGLPLWTLHRLLAGSGAGVATPPLERCRACPAGPSGGRA